MLSHLLRVMMSCAALVRTSAVLQGGPRAAARGCRWRGTAVLHLRTRSVASREHSGHGENLPLHAHTHPSRYGDKFIPRGPSAVPSSRDGGTAPALTRVRTGARVAAELRDEGAERVRAPSYLNYTHVRTHERALDLGATSSGVRHERIHGATTRAEVAPSPPQRS